MKLYVERLRPLVANIGAERAVIGVTVVVIVSIAFALAGLTWRVLGADDGRDRVALAPGGPVATTAMSDITPILALAPFGGSSVAKAQASTTGLILRAIFMAFPAESSSAVIAIGEAKAEAVMPGQSLSSGAVVETIARDHVMLNVGGRVERLDFPGVVPPVVVATGVAPAPATGPAPAVAAATPGTTPTGVVAPANAPAPTLVEQYRQRLAGNSATVASSLGVTATAGGYRVGTALSPELRAAGLQPGDVVEKVNNQPVGSIETDRQLLDQAITSGGARVEVLRNGRRVTLSFPLR